MNAYVLTYYPPGVARKTPHSDDESYLNPTSSLCAFTVGGDREFGLYNKKYAISNPKKSYILSEKSLMIMHPGSQNTTKHLVMSND